MANHKSAKKRIRQTARRTEVNTARVSRIRTFVKKVETAIKAGDKVAAAVALKEAQTNEYRAYIEQVVKNAAELASALTQLGYAIVAGKTENHLMLIDLTNKKVTGQVAQDRLGAVGITVNKNTIPHEPRSPFDPSGIRLGTPPVTTRGMQETDMRQIARFIDEAITDPHAAPSLKKQVANFAQKFPLFQWSVKK